MRNLLIGVVGLFALICIVYAVLGYFVFFRYGPLIEKEEARQEGWTAAIAEIEKECSRVAVDKRKAKANLDRERGRLQKAVENEEVRASMLKKNLKGASSPSSEDWKRTTYERLARAQRALEDFDVGKGDTRHDEKVVELRQRLAALKARRDELQALYERRDCLMVWPLQLLAPHFENKSEK